MSRGRINVAAVMKTRMPPYRGSESTDLDDVAVPLTLANIARKRRGKATKDEGCPHRSINTSISSPVMPVFSYIFRGVSARLVQNNGRKSCDINCLANQMHPQCGHFGHFAKSLRTTKLAKCLRPKKALAKTWRSPRRHFAKRLRAILRTAFIPVLTTEKVQSRFGLVVKLLGW